MTIKLNTMGKKENITRKIKALLNKNVKNGATKHEMESALMMANTLMLEYHILEHDLIDEEQTEKLVSETFNTIKSGYDLTIFYHDLSNLFDCQYYYNSDNITFFGYKKDVMLAGYFYKLITKACLYEKDLFLKSEEAKLLRNNHHGRSLASSFIKGFLIAVSLKMDAIYKERKNTLKQEYGLMVLDKKQRVDEEFSLLDLDLKITNIKELIVERQAFHLGEKRGEKFQLTQGITERENNTNNKIYSKHEV